MERGESKLRFRTQTRAAQFKFPSEGRLKFLLITSISSFLIILTLDAIYQGWLKTRWR